MAIIAIAGSYKMSKFVRLVVVALAFGTLASTAAFAGNVNLIGNFAKTVCGKPGTAAGKCLKNRTVDEEVADLDLSEDGELDMVGLQQTMSQRALAIQLATQMMGQLNGPCEICDNIR